MKHRLRIATRQSPLALWQAHHIKMLLQKAFPACQIDLLGITTTGDKNQANSLSQVGGKRLFVKELEQALLDDEADLAVHSMKDMPVDLPSDLKIVAILEREDPRDVLLSKQFPSLAALPQAAKVGTASLRRTCQLYALRPDLIVEPLRGNIDTRIKRLDDGQFAAVILASAGVKRLNLQSRIREYFSPDDFLPAVGQGALGIECRANDNITAEMVKILDHPITHLCVTAERAMNQRLEGGCQAPVAALATVTGDQLHIKGLVGTPDGRKILYASTEGTALAAQELGWALADDLLRQGAGEILQQIKCVENGFIV